MEKLIDLLNEYNEWWHWRDENFDRNKLLVISKGYWFIKWLVESNKIELDAWPLYWCQLIMYNRQPYTLYETILMLLAIEENPINLSCSILK